MTASTSQNWLPSQVFTACLALVVSVIALALVNLVYQRPKLPNNAPKLISGWPVFGSVGFYLRRNDFLNIVKKNNRGQSFTFYYGRYPIVGLVGDAGRALLYTSRPFDLRAGFSTLLAASPAIESDIDNPAAGQLNLFKKILTQDRLADSMQHMIQDSDESCSGLDGEVLSIFPHMYRLVYRLTHRTAGVHEIAENATLLDATLKHMATIEHCSPLQIMFPGVPLLGMLSKLWAGFNFHRVLVGLMSERRKTGRRESDALQYLMDIGEPDLEIVKCIIGLLFAGLINTGIGSAWLLCYLAENREWYVKVQTEVDSFISRNRRTRDEEVLDTLQQAPYSDWERQLPTIYLCLHETLRLNISGPAFRKNLSNQDLVIPGTNQVVPKQAFAFYAMEDAHLDESIYADALRWDPARHLPGREEGAGIPHSFLGWGSGLHPCVGIKYAKLEIVMATVLFFAHNDFQLIESNGQPRTSKLPQINRNELSVKPPRENIYIKCSPRRRAE